MTEVAKADLPYVQNLCEKDDCKNMATRIIKDLSLYAWVCDECYGKYRQ